jgi:hypothetical protein
MKPSDSRAGESAHGVLRLSYPVISSKLSGQLTRHDSRGKRIVADDPIIPVARNLRFY